MVNAEPLRVLHVCSIMNTGGAETFIMNIYRKLDRTRIQFDFVVHSTEKGFYDDEIKKLGGRIFRVPKFKSKNVYSYFKSWNDFFKTQPKYKVMHSHVRSTASIFFVIAKKHGVITISHSHSTSSGKGINAIVKNLLQYPLRYIADYFFACSEDAGRWLFGKKVMRSGKFNIIPNAIDIEKFIFNDNKREESRKKLDIGHDEFVVGHIGRFNHGKNHEFIIEIFKEIQTRESSTLLLVGDGILRYEIEKKVDSLNLTDRVRFLGIRADIPEVMHAMDIFLFPSHFEGFGIVLLEAQAAGMHCVTSDVVPSNTNVGMDSIEYISLNKPAKEWADRVLLKKDKRRNEDVRKIKDLGFDATNVTSWLSNFYQSV